MKRFVAIVASALMATSAHGQAVAGIAIVQAAEATVEICIADTAAKAFACAKRKCVEKVHDEDSCEEMTYCRTGYTADVFMQNKVDMLHWHEYSCGWADKEAAIQAAKLMCNPRRMKSLLMCIPTGIIDENGNFENIVVK